MPPTTKVNFSGKLGGFQRDKVSGAFISRASDPVHELTKKVTELELKVSRLEAVIAKLNIEV